MTKFISTKAVVTFIVIALTSVSASAASLGGLGNFGNYLGTFSGNDSVSALFDDLGLDADLIEKIDTPDTSEGFLSIFNATLNGDNEIISGEWSFTGSEIITHIVIKAGPMYSIFEFTDGLNMGFFDTSMVDNKGLSHITAYAAAPVPLPAAVWFLLSGCIGLLGFGKKQRNTV